MTEKEPKYGPQPGDVVAGRVIRALPPAEPLDLDEEDLDEEDLDPVEEANRQLDELYQYCGVVDGASKVAAGTRVTQLIQLLLVGAAERLVELTEYSMQAACLLDKDGEPADLGGPGGFLSADSAALAEILEKDVNASGTPSPESKQALPAEPTK